MSTILQPRTIRCKATFGGKIPGQTLADTATGQIIATYRGNATTFQFGFFGYSDGLPMELDDVQSLNLKIQPTQTPGGAVLADQTLAAEDLDLTLDAGTWADGSKQHAAFAFTNAEMNLDPQGARRTLWLVITALMTGGEEVTLAAGTMNLHEDNSAAADPPPENPGTAVTLEQGDARWETPAGAASGAAAQIIAATKGVIVTSHDGLRVPFAPAANTNAARGAAFAAAHAYALIAASGFYAVTIDCSPGRYEISKLYDGTTIGGARAQFAIVDKMTVRLNGATLYKKANASTAHNALTVGKYYIINSSGGTANWISVGAVNNNGGQVFQATGTAVNTGTGVVYDATTAMFAVAHKSGALGGNDWSILGPGVLEGTAATTATNGFTGEIGITVNASNRWRVDGITGRYFQGTGLQANNASFTGNEYSGWKISTGHVSNCNFDENNIGIANYAGNEYINFDSTTANKCLTGWDIYAGNTKCLGCEASLNTNYALRIRNGGNDGHGCWVGGWITHNPGISIYVEGGMDNGFIFSDSVIAGDSTTIGRMDIRGGGVQFSDCYLDVGIQSGSTPTGINRIQGCYIAGTYTDTSTLTAAARAVWRFENNNTLTGKWEQDDDYPTITAGGTTGARTIDKKAGRVNFAAAATSLVVTNAWVTANSIITATVATNDSTMRSVQAVAGSGSFTLYANVAPTAETRVNFSIMNQ